MKIIQFLPIVKKLFSKYSTIRFAPLLAWDVFATDHLKSVEWLARDSMLTSPMRGGYQTQFLVTIFLSEVGKLNFLRPHQSKSSSEFIFSRISDEEEQSGKEKLMIMRFLFIYR